MTWGPPSTTFRMHHPYAYRVDWKGGVTVFLASLEGGRSFFQIAGHNCPTPPLGNRRPLPNRVANVDGSFQK